jgi:hypothetical protein
VAVNRVDVVQDVETATVSVREAAKAAGPEASTRMCTFEVGCGGKHTALVVAAIYK